MSTRKYNAIASFEMKGSNRDHSGQSIDEYQWWVSSPICSTLYYATTIISIIGVSKIIHSMHCRKFCENKIAGFLLADDVYVRIIFNDFLKVLDAHSKLTANLVIVFGAVKHRVIFGGNAMARLICVRDSKRAISILNIYRVLVHFP